MKLPALLSSMPFESTVIRAAMKNVRTSSVAGKKIYQGTLSGAKVILTHTGIGKINAAHSATCMIEKFSVDGIINLGVAGAYSGSGLGNGDVAIATMEIYGDDGVNEAHGWSSMDAIGIPLVQHGNKKYFNEFPLKNKLYKQMIKLMPGSSVESQFTSGPFVTLSSVSGSPARAKEIEKRFQGICENMEGAAIAHICALYKIPFFEVRGISNTAGMRDRRTWDLTAAADNCQRLVLASLNNNLP